MHTEAGASQAVAIALGTNMGDRVANLRRALQLLPEHGVQVAGVSRLYETAAAYVREQPRFLNAALVATTRLPPLRLLEELKAIEAALGRDFSAQRYGPRPVDLDVVFYEDARVDEEALQVPHPRWQERPFVQAPLSDLLDTLPLACGSGKRLRRQLEQVHRLWQPAAAHTPPSELCPVLPLGPDRVWRWGEASSVMGVVNVTPDSFSDGGDHFNPQAAAAHGERLAEAGAAIVDVGGQSTRPGAVLVSEEEEAGRVIPVVRALAESGQLGGALISIDTFYASVAREAVAAGAHIINDVSGGSRDREMHGTVAELGVPYILMHMRGNPQTMQQQQHTAYGDVCQNVAAELNASVAAALKAGVLPWSIVLDPGLGFAKTGRGSLQLIAGLRPLRAALAPSVRGQPLLLGPSRKGFLGRVTGRAKAADRDYATAAVAALCVANGANIIRAHNVPAVLDAIKVADALQQLPEC